MRVVTHREQINLNPPAKGLNYACVKNTTCHGPHGTNKNKNLKIRKSETASPAKQSVQLHVVPAGVKDNMHC
jgi:hypothetical protein